MSLIVMRVGIPDGLSHLFRPLSPSLNEELDNSMTIKSFVWCGVVCGRRSEVLGSVMMKRRRSTRPRSWGRKRVNIGNQG